jgi:hypothetical protein
LPKLGPYAKEIVLSRPDGRTKEARLLKQMREKLVAQLGGEGRLRPAQRVLIERIAMLQLKVALLDARIIAGTMTDYDHKSYLAYANSLSRMLEKLGLNDPASGAPADPMDAIRRHVSAQAEHAA